jgi:hypothetical protein
MHCALSLIYFVARAQYTFRKTMMMEQTKISRHFIFFLQEKYGKLHFVAITTTTTASAIQPNKAIHTDTRINKE